MSTPIDRQNISTDSNVTSIGVFANHRIDQQLRLLEISEMLHRKLELDLLLECFFVESQSISTFEGLSYTTPEDREVFHYGNARQYHQRFELCLSDYHLGDMVIQTSSPMSARQQRDVERILACLLYPLANAVEYRKAVHASWVDSSTGINNRLALDNVLPREMLLSRRSETPLSVLVLDLDHFHMINDNHGHAIGDELIQKVADTLSRNLRANDIIFRLEMDSFVVILGNTEFDGAQVVSERLRTCIDTCFRYENVQLVQNASAGVTEMVESDDAETILTRARSALLNAKRAGRNRIRSLQGVVEA